jgi:hypothetical protein
MLRAIWEIMERSLHQHLYRISCLCWLLAAMVFAAAGNALAATPESVPVTNGAINRDVARITFEWPEPVNFVADAKGKTLTITFDRKANPSFGKLLSNLYPYVTSAQQKKDGRSIVLKMDKAYKIRTFMSDNVGGVDLLNIDPAKRAALQGKPAGDVQAMAPLSPSAGTETTAPAAAGVAAQPEPAAAPAPVLATPAPEAAAPMAATDSSAAMPDPNAPAVETAKSDGRVRVNISASDDSVVLRFPFSERMAISTFIRNSTLWVVLGKKTPLNLSDFDSLPKTVIGKAELVSGDVTALRIPVNDNISVSTAAEENSFEWAILLTQAKKLPANPLKIDINTDPPAPPHVFINALETGEPVQLRDPVIGDNLIVTPLFKLGEGTLIEREFIEFKLLQTAQGVVVAKKADDVTVVPLRNGLRISLPQGATLTPGLPEIDKSALPESLQSVPTLFPYDKWKLPASQLSERAQIRSMMHAIVESKDMPEANDLRLRLAQFHLNLGMAPEAIAMLDGIERTDPGFYKGAKLSALRGAANFLMYRFNEAAKDFSASELNNNKETDYWRNMLADLVGKAGKYDYLALNEDYISKYPPVFRQRLAIVAADRSVDAKEYNTALKIFETLRAAAPLPKESKDPKEKEQVAAKEGSKPVSEPPNSLIAPINNYINYLMAKISSDTGQSDESIKILNQLADDTQHPYVRARAEFSRILWEMNHDVINKAQVIDRLERLRLAWHGDTLELKVLGFLGDIYSENKDYINAMRIWDNAVNAFPGTPQALEYSNRMEETFILMFNEGIADTLSPLDALALYYQYKHYAPPGNVGREMISHLADRLVTIDLLDQAASLLEHQMRYDAEKSQRSQIGAKVATIYLLNHQPRKALHALEDSVYGENPALLHQLRNRLAAQALIEQGDVDKAWQILGHDDSSEAERIRLSILWQRRDWPRVVTTVENMLKTRKDITAPITADESEFVIQLALAYIFEDNKEQLQYLRDYFTPLMANNPNKQVFDFITAGDIVPTPTNFDDVIKNISSTRSFIDQYKARIQTAGLDAAIKAGGTAATP